MRLDERPPDHRRRCGQRLLPAADHVHAGDRSRATGRPGGDL